MAHKKNISCTGRAPNTLITMKGRSTRTDKGYNLYVDCICDCGVEFTSRRHNIKPDNTISCGCVGRGKFKEYHTNFANKLNEAKVIEIWDKVNDPDKRMSRALVAKQHRMTKYQVDYIVARGYDIIKSRIEAFSEHVKEYQVAMYSINCIRKEYPEQPFATVTERSLRRGVIFNLEAELEMVRAEKEEIRTPMKRCREAALEREDTWQDGLN
jgi:hypothetical protein